MAVRTAVKCEREKLLAVPAQILKPEIRIAVAAAAKFDQNILNELGTPLRKIHVSSGAVKLS